jgi:hypothetical protein
MGKLGRKLIISMHIPKTGGTSLLREIQDGAMGRFLLDYERPGAGRHFFYKKLRIAEQYLMARIRRRQLLQNYDVIHGHFSVGKYAFLYPQADFITFMREPVARILSTYYYYKHIASKNPASVRKNPNILLVSENRMGILEFAGRDSMQTFYARFTAGFPLHKFSFIGITERYSESIMALNRLLGTQIEVRHERNNDYSQYEYEYAPLLPDLRKLNQDNTRIYEEAVNMFERRMQEL